MSKRGALFAGMTGSFGVALYFVGTGLWWHSMPWFWHPGGAAVVGALWVAVQCDFVAARLPDGCDGCRRLTKRLEEADEALCNLQLPASPVAGKGRRQ